MKKNNISYNSKERRDTYKYTGTKEDYKDLTLEILEDFLLELTKDPPTTMFINEGHGFIPIEQSKTFDEAIKKYAKDSNFTISEDTYNPSKIINHFKNEINDKNTKKN